MTLFDVTDLLLYLLEHTTLSGIQRVQCEILRHLPEISESEQVRFAVVNQRGVLGTIETSALLDIIEHVRSHRTSTRDVRAELRRLLGLASPWKVQPRDVFISIGAFWNVLSIGSLLQRLKNSGAFIGVFIHDILPIIAREYFVPQDTRLFVKSVTEALTFADFILTTSQFNKTSLTAHMAARKLGPLPIHVAPLGHALSLAAPNDATVSTDVAEILDRQYVLCVGTLEVRKNPAYLFNVWQMMVRSGRSDIPHLVFVGRQGWLVQDFLDQLRACGYLGEKIVVLHNVTDVELELLYRRCLFTAFPSFLEGWGLPVGESLAHGKICISSGAGGIPEVGGEFVDYVDPYNAGDGLKQVSRYLDDPELRRNREREIKELFQPRSWREAAEDVLRSTQVLARQARPFEGIAAIELPPGKYLPISSDAAASEQDGTGEIVSTDLICISGWQVPEIGGVRAAQNTSVLRFRAEAAVGAKINLVLRLAANGDDIRIRIQTGSGAETEASLGQGSEKVAVLPCEVEAERLVTAKLSSVAGEGSVDSYWMLKGVLYFDPKRLAIKALKALTSGNGLQSQALVAQPRTEAQPPDKPESVTSSDRISLQPAAMDEMRPAASFGAFLQESNCFWPSDFTSDRDAPIFADRADQRAFYSGYGGNVPAPEAGRTNDRISLVRRSDQLVSMSRLSEGSIFDRSGVWKAFGYLNGCPTGTAPWLTKEADGLWINSGCLSRAPWYEGSYLVFYNGNLRNYYHWLIEGLLCLDILSQALGRDSRLKIALPKSMDDGSYFDHRETLRAVGLARHEIVEVEADFIHVQEAIWIESDHVRPVPAPYLKDFQQRIASQYAGFRGPRNRRLLVARKGPARKIDNIEQVEALLSRRGFETVYLEGMSMADQILVFQSAEFIVSPHGAGLANLLFCQPGTKVIELMPSGEIRPFFWLISEKLELVHGMQFCEIASDRGYQSPITVDVGKLDALIRMVEAHI